MANIGFVVPESQQTKETFHGLRRTQEGLLYYAKIDKDTTATIDVNGGQPSSVQLPTSGGYVDADISYQTGETEYFTGDGSSLTFNMSNPVADGTRIEVYVNAVKQELNTHFTYSSPTITFLIAPPNGVQVAVAKINKEYKNNTSDFYQQYIFEDGDATYYIDDDGYLIKRENIPYGLTAIGSDDFSTSESTTYAEATTSYQDAV